MLPFKIHQIVLGGERFYFLLPKLNAGQLAVLEQRLVNLGYAVTRGKFLKAVKGRSFVNVASVGYAWSNEDLADVLAPAVPALLAEPKEEVPLNLLAGAYCGLKRTRDRLTIRFTPRMETSKLWEELRAGGLCALTPEEHAVFRHVLTRTTGTCEVLTDYPTDGCKVRRVGRRQYYESWVEAEEAGANLRQVGEKGVRNAYLPRVGLLTVRGSRSPVTSGFKRLFGDLGQWCYLVPTGTSRKLQSMDQTEERQAAQ